MSTIKEKVLHKIKKRSVQPRHALYFAIGHIVSWCIWTLAILVGALVFSALLFGVTNDGPGYHGGIVFHDILSFLPFLWIGLLCISSIIAYIQFRNTERGHVPPWGIVVLGNILLSLFVGVALFFFGFGYISERTVLHFKGTTVEHTYLNRLHNIDQGVIIGVATVIDEHSLSLQGIDGIGYIVDIAGIASTTIPTNIPIRVSGVLTDDGSFYACRVAPVRFHGAFRREEIGFHQVSEIKVEDERTNICRDIPTD